MIFIDHPSTEMSVSIVPGFYRLSSLAQKDQFTILGTTNIQTRETQAAQHVIYDDMSRFVYRRKTGIFLIHKVFACDGDFQFMLPHTLQFFIFISPYNPAKCWPTRNYDDDDDDGLCHFVSSAAQYITRKYHLSNCSLSSLCAKLPAVSLLKNASTCSSNQPGCGCPQ